MIFCSFLFLPMILLPIFSVDEMFANEISPWMRFLLPMGLLQTSHLITERPAWWGSRQWNYFVQMFQSGITFPPGVKNMLLKVEKISLSPNFSLCNFTLSADSLKILSSSSAQCTIQSCDACQLVSTLVKQILTFSNLSLLWVRFPKALKQILWDKKDLENMFSSQVFSKRWKDY